MHIVSIGDDLHEMLNPVFWEKYFKMSSAEIFIQSAKRQTGTLDVLSYTPEIHCEKITYHINNFSSCTAQPTSTCKCADTQMTSLKPLGKFLSNFL